MSKEKKTWKACDEDEEKLPVCESTDEQTQESAEKNNHKTTITKKITFLFSPQ